jgi:hypothetical protein
MEKKFKTLHYILLGMMISIFLTTSAQGNLLSGRIFITGYSAHIVLALHSLMHSLLSPNTKHEQQQALQHRPHPPTCWSPSKPDGVARTALCMFGLVLALVSISRARAHARALARSLSLNQSLCEAGCDAGRRLRAQEVCA